MASPNITFKRFIDLLLVRLYDLDRERGDKFFNLNEIAKQIKNEDLPNKWVFDAAKVLETRGWAACIFMRGGVQAQISGEGRLYVENDQGETDAIKKNPDHYYIAINGNQNQVAIGSPSQTISMQTEFGLASKLVEEMKDAIKCDPSLQGADRNEAAKYLDVLDNEVKKPEPNQNVLAAILQPLSKIVSIAGNVASLIQIING